MMNATATGTSNFNSKGSAKMKWKSDFDKSVVLDNFTDRNWLKSQGDGTFWLKIHSELN